MLSSKSLRKLCVALASPTVSEAEIQTLINKVKDLNEFTEQNLPPLAYTIISDRKDLMNLLLLKGADLNIKIKYSNYQTLLELAIFYKEDRTEMVRHMLARGADPCGINQDDPRLNYTTRYWIKRAKNRKPMTDREVEILKALNLTRLQEVDMFIVGQTAATSLLIKRMRSFFIDREAKVKPLVLLFVGPPGHGKTHLSESVGEILDLPFIKIACEKAKTNIEFFGANAPYVGSEHGTPLNNWMVENANKQCVVLLDEFDKTDPQVWQGILNTFEKGEWQDVRTRKIVNCSKTVFILTANCADNVIIEKFRKPEKLDSPQLIESLSKRVEDEVLLIIRRNFGEPFGRRIDYVIPFLPMHEEEERMVLVDTKLREWANKWGKPPTKEKKIGNIKIHIDPEVTKYIAKAYSVNEGAKSFDRVIERAQSNTSEAWLNKLFDKNGGNVYVELENQEIVINNYPRKGPASGSNGNNDDESEEEEEEENAPKLPDIEDSKQ